MNSIKKPTNKAQIRIQRLSWLLDNSIPLPGGYRIGWDAVIGLIPGIGDIFGALLSSYIVTEALRTKTPLLVIFRMLINILLEMLIGSIPFLGDLFDAAFKSNMRNVSLLEAHSQTPPTEQRGNKGILLIVFIATLLCLFMVLWVLWFLIKYAVGSVF